MAGRAIRARGIVQGVGFRPNIWRLAHQYQLSGKVWNDAQGVMIHAFGSETNLEAFIRAIPEQQPPLARLDNLEVSMLNESSPLDGEFQIVASLSGRAETPIAADAATCPDCLAEITDPNNRRYAYPFSNCTHCGPRLSIIRQVPYDRCHTSMDIFPMCPQCQQEYNDPANRRFHAQANCCPDCGPKLWLEDPQGNSLSLSDPIAKAAELIRQGYLIAIKGLGGFHLACNAADDRAVTTLRQRKHRYAKPFALMARDLEQIHRYAHPDSAETLALQDKTAAIVLLNADGRSLASGIAPEDSKLGFMLPYTPLHSLLLQKLDEPIVLTSANISDEPQCTTNEEAREKLAGIADFWLLHDRDIVNRLDDSVVRRLDNHMRVLRRARGYSPEALRLPQGFEAADAVLAMGAELKNSFCLLKKGQAIVAQHIGDLESAAVQLDYRKAIDLYRQLYDFQAQTLAIDSHPGYLSSQYAHHLADETTSLISVQHHHAHLAACLAEHGVGLNAPPVLAAIFDGLGYGDDSQLWGGEFFLGDYRDCSRLGHFQSIALPGGHQAMREPWRNTYAQLRHYFDWPTLQRQFANLPLIQGLATKPLSTLDTMLDKGLNSPLSSSCGRWFDAFAAALDLHRDQIDYEGQAAIAMETLAAPLFASERAYPNAWTLSSEACQVIRWQGLWQAVLEDLNNNINKARIAARIHHSLIDASTQLLMQLSHQSGIDVVVLSGGVFQNKLLLEGLSKQLRAQGKSVLSPQAYPSNDGGLALGQATIAAAQTIATERSI